jgi:hypothetical protein
MKLIEYYLEDIQTEAKRTTVTKVTRQTKIKRATGQLSTVAARKANDPLYKQMIKYRNLYYKYRDRLRKKYSPRVRARARR